MINLDEEISGLFDMDEQYMVQFKSESIKQLIREVIAEITPEALNPVSRGELKDKTGAVDDDVNLGYDYARELMQTKAKELGL